MNFSNQFLVAMPSMAGDGLDGRILAMMTHGTEGAMGLVINESSATTVADVLRQLGASPKQDFDTMPVFIGGPVESQKGFMLYEGEQRAASMPVCESLWLTSDRQILLDINENPPPRFMLFAGYAGWGQNQLEQEFANNYWLNLPIDVDLLFDADNSEKIKTITQANGIDFSRLSMHAGRA